MTEKTKEVEDEILDLFVKVNADFGNDDVMTRILSIIFLSPDEVSLEELMEKTGYSAATISNKTRSLMGFGMVKKVSKPGTKKVFYYADKDMRNIFCSSLSKILEVKVKPIKENLPGLIERYKKSISKTDNFAQKKLDILQNHLKNVSIIEDALNKFMMNIKG